METGNTAIYNRLQQEILSRQGYRAPTLLQCRPLGLVIIETAFPFNTFPLHTIHAFGSTSAEMLLLLPSASLELEALVPERLPKWARTIFNHSFIYRAPHCTGVLAAIFYKAAPGLKPGSRIYTAVATYYTLLPASACTELVCTVKAIEIVLEKLLRHAFACCAECSLANNRRITG